MIAELEIRKQLVRFLSNDLSLDQFEDWLVEASWNMHSDPVESAQKLAAKIELRLAEHSSGHLDEATLRHELVPDVTDINVFLPCSPSFVVAGSSSVTVYVSTQ